MVIFQLFIYIMVIQQQQQYKQQRQSKQRQLKQQYKHRYQWQQARDQCPQLVQLQRAATVKRCFFLGRVQI